MTSRLGRCVVLTVDAILLVLFVGGIVVYAVHGLHRPEALAPEWSAGELRHALEGLGLPTGAMVGYLVGLQTLVVVASALAAFFLVRSRDVSPFRLYLGFVLVFNATAGGGILAVIAEVYPGLAGASLSLEGLSWFALFPVAYLFPNGRFVPAWCKWLVAAWVGLALVIAISPPSVGEGPFVGATMAALLVSCVAAQIYRYARVSSQMERQQTKWVMLAVVLQLGYVVAVIAPPRTAGGLALDLGFALVSYTINAALPVAIGIAIVRYRLYDVDVLISRTLVYGTLTAFVIGTYVLIVGGIGALWRIGGNPILPLVATGLVAVLVNPLRRRLQRGVNRLLFGQRDDPYAVLTSLGRRLGSAGQPDLGLQDIVDTIGVALKLPYVSVRLADGREASYAVRLAGQRDTFPLLYRGEEVGELAVAARSGESLGASDRRLLVELARQAGVAVRAAV